MKTIHIKLLITLVVTLLALISVSAEEYIPVSDEFTDGEKFVNSEPKINPVEDIPVRMPASKTSSTKPFPTQAATSGRPTKPTPVVKSAVSKANRGLLSRIFGFLAPSHKDLEDSFNDDVGMGISNRR